MNDESAAARSDGTSSPDPVAREPAAAGAAVQPHEQAFLAEHALKRPLKVLDIWALGVGVVITGEYFGWNSALKDHNGPVAVLVASLVVWLFDLKWGLAMYWVRGGVALCGG